MLRQVLRTLGQDRCAAILADTLMSEANGGMLTKDGTRRRTPGGVFFQLVKERVTPQERRRLFPPPAPQHGQRQPQQQPMTLPWDQVPIVIQILTTHPAGEAHTMKVTLIGRPGKVETRDQAVVFRMQGKPPVSLPRGLPHIPSTPALTWNVMVALRQWNRVKDSLAAHADDTLIIEGHPVVAGEGTHVLLAQTCTSMVQQRAKKQAKHPPQAEATP